jgi:hypothetical protein
MLIKIIRYFIEKKAEWENTCKKCGQCCYEKQKKHGQYYINFNAPCEYLNTKTKTCSVYRQRFKICADCRKVNLFHAKFSGFLPDTCGYVEKYRQNTGRKINIKNDLY